MLIGCWLSEIRMKTKCFYTILGVPIRATQEEIKKAFRLLALRWHPDRNSSDSGSAERFKEVLEAYETLVDPGRRRQYDRVRGYGRQVRSKRGSSGVASRGGSDSLRDLVQEAFGIQFEGPRQQKRNDLRFDLQVSRGALSEGTLESIEFHRWMFCEDCAGKGHRARRGTCGRCKGDGGREECVSLLIRIPGGSEDGDRVRISGMGDRVSPGVAPGDLVVLLHAFDG